MTIALDIDGVIVDFVSSFILTLKNRYNFTLNYGEIYCHDIGQVLGLSKKDVDLLLYETLERNDFHLIHRAKESIDFLNTKHKIVLVTGRNEKFQDLTEIMLSKHEIKFQQLYFSRYLEKHNVEIQFDVFVEDSVEEAVSLFHKRDTKILLFSHPWNVKSLNISNAFTRVYSWENILSEIEDYESKQKLSTAS